MHFRADGARIDQELGDRVEAHVGNTRDSAHRHSLAQKVEDLDAGFGGELSHAHFDMSFLA
jgi:hypothetical protein